MPAFSRRRRQLSPPLLSFFAYHAGHFALMLQPGLAPASWLPRLMLIDILLMLLPALMPPLPLFSLSDATCFHRPTFEFRPTCHIIIVADFILILPLILILLPLFSFIALLAISFSITLIFRFSLPFSLLPLLILLLSCHFAAIARRWLSFSIIFAIAAACQLFVHYCLFSFRYAAAIGFR